MGHKDDIIKNLKKRIAILEKSRDTDDDASLKLEGDPLGRFKDWEPLEQVVAQVQKTIDDMKAGKWSWAKNWACKYVDIRIDMRDGHAIICNRNGRISLEGLNYQWKAEEENEL